VKEEETKSEKKREQMREAKIIEEKWREATKAE
jgi:hypothetical protein